MGPVHLYLAAWVAGGVLLGVSMLLDGRQREAEDMPDAFGDPTTDDSLALPGSAPRNSATGAVRLRPEWPSRFVRVRSVLPMGLVGFGLSGLAAKGFDLDHWPWSFVCSVAVGLGLIGLGYLFTRPRSW
jgi:hypothetical protein